MDQADLAARNVTRLQDIYGRYARGDRSAIFEVLSPNVRWDSLGDAAVTWAGSHHGPDGVRAYFAALDDAITVTGYEVEQIIAQGEWVAVLARITFRSRITGEAYDSPKADFIRLVGDEVLEFREFYDTAPAATACRAARAALVQADAAGPT